MASRLPTTIPSTASHPKINLIIHTPVPVSYSHVQSSIPPLLTAQSPDLALHVGLAGGRKYFALEKTAPRDGYTHADVDGRVWDEETSGAVPGQRLPTDPSEPSDPASTKTPKTPARDEWPERLETSLEYSTLASKAIKKCHDLPIELRESDDVGSYLCGFIYYATMGWYRRRHSRSPLAASNVKLLQPKGGETDVQSVQTGGPAMFLHVPPCPTSEDVENGTRVVLAVIEAMVETWLKHPSNHYISLYQPH